ncbi:BMC domain-containing protein [Gracilibacillus ureilyticus]|uniref:BMC domain-containing protein n=1 Tax=Gracilibacillus ureilyticus TaxID=531814 RepID=A0A1H9P018_9BACI|nr:BMC domain-containing protein [Gracilibacillus ureilyticus]SER41624.1 BMC domain-containing protein [Gracilibacillus ureilyticus]
MYQSLGIIEVEGLVTATSAIDAMCKHAFVEVVHIEKTGSGWVTVLIQGDLASVQAALEVGAETAYRHGQVVAVKSIPRPDEELYGKLIPKAGDS